MLQLNAFYKKISSSFQCLSHFYDYSHFLMFHISSYIHNLSSVKAYLSITSIENIYQYLWFICGNSWCARSCTRTVVYTSILPFCVYSCIRILRDPPWPLRPLPECALSASNTCTFCVFHRICAPFAP